MKAVRDAELAGDEVIRENRPKELRFVWTNLRTCEWWHIQSLSTISRLDRTDPSTKIIIGFCAGVYTAQNALTLIERLGNLTAFW